MTLKSFLSVLNCMVRYRVIDRFTKNDVMICPKDKETLNRKIYMVFQSDDSILEIYLY